MEPARTKAEKVASAERSGVRSSGSIPSSSTIIVSTQRFGSRLLISTSFLASAAE